jgi:DNA replication and repair protein RecF
LLSTGPATGRRTLLDRLALYMDPLSADHRARYLHALRARQQILQAGRPGELDVFEELCAIHGCAVTRARRLASEVLASELRVAFERIAAPGLRLEARYCPGGDEDATIAASELLRQRRADGFRKSAGFGPHRDDLALSLDGHPVRVVASQGQHRAITLALKAAETACVAEARGVEPILLLDDVSSELDRDRTVALLAFLGDARGQIFVTTTRPDLIDTPLIAPADRADFALRDGKLEGAPRASKTAH